MERRLVKKSIKPWPFFKSGAKHGKLAQMVEQQASMPDHIIIFTTGPAADQKTVIRRKDIHRYRRSLLRSFLEHLSVYTESKMLSVQWRQRYSWLRPSGLTHAGKIQKNM